SFQTLKKFYGMLEVECEKFLVLDSESLWVRNTNMTELFESHFSNPVLLYSEINEERFSSFCQNIQNNINLISCRDNKKWFIEEFMWYYDKSILTNMFFEYGFPIEIVDKVFKNGSKDVGVFEILLYRNYLFNNYEKYNYQLVNVTEHTKNILSKYNYENYFFELSHRFNNDFGLLEITMMLLNKSNVVEFSQLFSSLGINIIRCEWGDRVSQERFISEVKPYIFAASQAHPYSVLSDSIEARNKFYSGYYKLKFKDFIKKLMLKFMPSYKFGVQVRDMSLHTHIMLDKIIQKLDKKD
ncbi:hypothetical protein ACWIVY_09775, partial [Ursidibacter sp. B-7004-1]